MDSYVKWAWTTSSEGVLEHERNNIMNEAHYGPAGGNFQADTTAKKIQQSGLWWPTLHKDCKKFVSQCDRCQRLGRPLPSTEMPLISINSSLTFEIWAIDIIGPFPIPTKRTGARYILNCSRVCNQVSRGRTSRHMFQ